MHKQRFVIYVFSLLLAIILSGCYNREATEEVTRATPRPGCINLTQEHEKHIEVCTEIRKVSNLKPFKVSQEDYYKFSKVFLHFRICPEKGKDDGEWRTTELIPGETYSSMWIGCLELRLTTDPT